MRGVRASVGLVAVVLLTVGAYPVAAFGQAIPPGYSEIDQYSESIQFAEGERTLDRNRDPGGTPVPTATLNMLQQGGAEGKTAAELALATAPGEQVQPADGDGETGSALDGILDALAEGLLLLLLLGATLAIGMAYILNRRRSAG